ncbi:transcription repressor OFP12-like [Solanum dulcamara]|uniref:transcription repressor OFP12-like n=1 Tax=Solanum dulcamara TaxID=45834 RepID=UPI002486A72F|nr:transcription repressor OFP12-like [Solanum dulcamara]
MPRILQKKFYHFLPSFKCLPTILSLPFEETEEEKTEQKKTMKNFNSVFDIPSSDSTTTSKSFTNSSIATTEEEEDNNNNNNNIFSSFEDSDYTDSNNIPDFSDIFASQRFFFSSPGNSNSIIDFSMNNHSAENPKEVVTGGVAVQTYSPDPYSDFRRSMEEMVEAHELTNVKANWEFLHELLLCYLNLNPKHTHKYIIGAYSDLVVSLMTFEDSGKKDGRFV